MWPKKIIKVNEQWKKPSFHDHYIIIFLNKIMAVELMVEKRIYKKITSYRILNPKFFTIFLTFGFLHYILRKWSYFEKKKNYKRFERLVAQ